MARPHSPFQRAIQRWWIGIIRESEWSCHYEPSRRFGTTSEGIDCAEELREGRLPRKNRVRGIEGCRSRTERSRFDGERHQPSSGRSKGRNDGQAGPGCEKGGAGKDRKRECR